MICFECRDCNKMIEVDLISGEIPSDTIKRVVEIHNKSYEGYDIPCPSVITGKPNFRYSS